MTSIWATTSWPYQDQIPKAAEKIVVHMIER